MEIQKGDIVHMKSGAIVEVAFVGKTTFTCTDNSKWAIGNVKEIVQHNLLLDTIDTTGCDNVLGKINPPHYNKDKRYDVYSFVHHNSLGMLEGNVIKYVARHKKKNGKEDLLKAIETINRLIDMEYGQD